MKKRFGVMLLVATMMLAGCGKGTEPVAGPDGSAPTEAIEKETETSAPVTTKATEKDKEVSDKPDEVTTPTETPEKTEEVDVPVTNSLHEIQNNEKTVFGRRHDALDSKDKKESLLSFSGSLSDYGNVREITYWKTAIKTIQDMCFCLETRNFVYDFNKEPEMGYLWNVTDDLERWTWTPAAETIYEMSGGVCIQVAQLAAYMLAEDYEDWGAIQIEGNQGHIFNWFYEDGYYYLFDFTQVISENYEYMNHRILFRDYSKYVVKCQSMEEIKEYCTTKKVDLSQNYAIYMYSCHGYDFLPCNVNTGMSDSNAVLNNTWDGDHIKIRFQDIVMEDLVVLWENPKSTPIVWEGVELDKVSKDIPYVYGREEYIYRHGY